MRQSKHAERSMDKLLQMLAAKGVSSDVLEEAKETAPTGREAISRQGEAVLLFLESPAKFTTKLCKRCGEAFGTNYRSVGYCSDNCRAKEISTQLGIKWDWLKPEHERWGGEPPLVIPPEAYQKLRQFVEFFAALPLQSQSPTQTHLHQNPESTDEDQEPELTRTDSEDRQKDDAQTSLAPLPLQSVQFDNLPEFSFADFE